MGAHPVCAQKRAPDTRGCASGSLGRRGPAPRPRKGRVAMEGTVEGQLLCVPFDVQGQTRRSCWLDILVSVLPRTETAFRLRGPVSLHSVRPRVCG